MRIQECFYYPVVIEKEEEYYFDFKDNSLNTVSTIEIAQDLCVEFGCGAVIFDAEGETKLGKMAFDGSYYFFGED